MKLETRRKKIAGFAGRGCEFYCCSFVIVCTEFWRFSERSFEYDSVVFVGRYLRSSKGVILAWQQCCCQVLVTTERLFQVSDF